MRKMTAAGVGVALIATAVVANEGLRAEVGERLEVAAPKVGLDVDDNPFSAPHRKPAPESDAKGTEPIDSSAEACIAKRPLEWRIGQLLMPGIRGEDVRKAMPILDEYQAGGVLLMSSASKRTISLLQEGQEVPRSVAVDEEGGAVQRFSGLGKLPSARQAAETLTPREYEELISDHAAKLKKRGVTISFGTVVDVAPEIGEGPMGDRTFSNDPDKVTVYGKASVDGWKEAGVLPVLKHWPGHGSATEDTHRGPAKVPRFGKLEERDLRPYDSLKGNAVMVGHLNVPGLTPKNTPASLSSYALDALRERGYEDSLIFSDSLSMGAITDKKSNIGTAVVAALAAGDDVAVYLTRESPQGMEKDLKQIHRTAAAAVAAGTLTQEDVNDSVRRVLRQKRVDPCALVG